MELNVSESLVNSIQSEIQRATKDLENVDESIRKLTGRDFLDQPRNEKRQRLNSTNQDNAVRKPSVLSRLGGKVSHFGGRKVQEVAEDNVIELNHNKPSLASSVIPRPQVDGKSRTEVVAELNKDKATNARNRRMFGSLLGTLQRFSKDEAKQQFRDDRRAKIIQKVEEKSKAEKEKLWQERRDLLAERKEKQVRIRQLHRKMDEMKQYEAWEAYRRSLGRFIRTKAKPQIFWMPKTSHSRSSQLVSATKEAIEEELQSKRNELNNDLNDLLGKVNLKSKVSNEYDGSVVVSEAEDDEERGSLDGSQSDFKNGSDILDYEENVLLYEDALMLPGKQGNTLEKGKKMVVQVNRENSESARRRVEMVNVEREARLTKRARGESGSEGENVRRRKVTVTYRNGVDEGEKAAAPKEGKSGPKRVKGEKPRSSVERGGSVRNKAKMVVRKKKSSKGSSSHSASSSSSDNDSVEEVKQRTKKRKKQPPPSSSSSESDKEPKSLPKKRLEHQPVRRVIAPSKNSVRRPPSLPPTSPAPATPPSPSDLLDQALEDLTGEIEPSLANEQKRAERERVSTLRSNNYNSSDHKLKEIVVQRVSSANNHSGRLVKGRQDRAMEGPTVLFDNTTIKKEKEDPSYVETTIEKVKLETVKKEEDAETIPAASDPNKTKQKSTVCQDKSTGVIAKEAPKVKKPERTSRKKNKKASSGSDDGGSSDSDTDKETVAASKKKKSSDSSSDSDEESRKGKRKSKQSRMIRKKRRESSSNSSGSDVAKKSRTDKKRRKRSSSSSSGGSDSGSGSTSSASSSDDDSTSDRKAKNKSKTEKGARKKAAPPPARDRRSDRKEPQRSKGRDRRSRSRSRRRSRERATRKSRK